MIDTSSWKKFKISDLFGTAKLGKYHNPKDLQEDDNGYEYICASNFNNGVNLNMPRVKGKNLSLTDEHIVAWGKQCPCFSYHKDSCVTSQGMYYYSVGTISELSALFLCSCFQSLCNSKGYGYNDCLIGVTMDNEVVKLPATLDGQPDWGYIESYMKAVMEESEKALSNLKKADDTKHLIDVSGWSKFSCKELFECKNTGNILARDVIDRSGDIPYVTASGYNNGVVAHIDASNYEIIKGHCILVGGKTFTITYQKDDFVSNDSHNFTIRVKDYDISDLDYLYLTSMIYVYFGQKYSWNDAVTKDKLLDESIPLPITSTGEPDWQYMEDYMKKIMDKQEMAADNLSKTKTLH